MTTYYLLNSDGTLGYFSNARGLLEDLYPGQAVYHAEEEIVPGPGGLGAYLKSRRPPDPMEMQQARAIREFEAAVTERLDEFAHEKQYDSMDKARLAALTVDFKPDGDFANKLYDEVWAAAFALEEEIKNWTMSVDEALKKLPEMIWPKQQTGDEQPPGSAA